jgi:hypothetical protein
MCGGVTHRHETHAGRLNDDFEECWMYIPPMLCSVYRWLRIFIYTCLHSLNAGFDSMVWMVLCVVVCVVMCWCWAHHPGCCVLGDMQLTLVGCVGHLSLRTDHVKAGPITCMTHGHGHAQQARKAFTGLADMTHEVAHPHCQCRWSGATFLLRGWGGLEGAVVSSKLQLMFWREGEASTACTIFRL